MTRPQFRKQRPYEMWATAEFLRQEGVVHDGGDDPLDFFIANQAVGGRLQWSKREAMRRFREAHPDAELPAGSEIAVDLILWGLSQRPAPYVPFAEIASWATDSFLAERSAALAEAGTPAPPTEAAAEVWQRMSPDQRRAAVRRVLSRRPGASTSIRPE